MIFHRPRPRLFHDSKVRKFLITSNAKARPRQRPRVFFLSTLAGLHAFRIFAIELKHGTKQDEKHDTIHGSRAFIRRIHGLQERRRPRIGI
jgi:hypothetical protein